MTFPTAAATITRRKSFGTAAAMVVLLLLKPKYLSAKLVGLSSVFSDPPDKLAGCYRQCVMSSSPGAEQLDGQEPPAIRKQKAPPKRGFFWSLQERGLRGNLGSPRFRSLPGHVTRSASYMSVPSMILFITTEGSAPELATIWRSGSSSARLTILMPAS